MTTSVLDLPPGLHRGVPEHVYHQRVPGLVSKGALDRVRRSPAHYKAWLEGAAADETSDALTFGKGFHCAVLEPERFALEYVVEPAFGDCRKTANKASRDLWREENKGAVWLSDEDHRAFAGMAASVRSHPLASKMLADGVSELTVRWKDPATGLECKARADHYRKSHRMGVDVKTAEDASYEAFRKSAAAYGYHRQSALYADGFEAVGEPLDHFVFVVVEKRPPYAVATYVLDVAAVTLGRVSVREAMARLAECIESDRFPAYPEQIQVLELPSWAA